MKELKEMQESLAALDKKMDKSLEELKASYDVLSKRYGGADYNTPVHLEASSPQISPADGLKNNPNLNGKDSDFKFQQWAQGAMEHIGKLHACMGEMYASIKSYRDTMWNLHDGHSDRMGKHEKNFNDHVSNGHIPKIMGADKMNKALAALGLSGDYEAKKKTVNPGDSDIQQTKGLIPAYASKDKRGNEIFEFEIKTTKK